MPYLKVCFYIRCRCGGGSVGRRFPVQNQSAALRRSAATPVTNFQPPVQRLISCLFFLVVALTLAGRAVAAPTNIPPVVQQAGGLPGTAESQEFPKLLTYIAVADLATGVSWRTLPNNQRLVLGQTGANLGAKIIIKQAGESWKQFPDAGRDGENLQCVRLGPGKQLLLDTQLAPQAIVDSPNQLITRAPSAKWQQAAIWFQHKETAFQFMLVDQDTPPAAVLQLNAASALQELTRAPFHAQLRPELLATLRLRSLHSPQRANVRLTAPFIRQLITIAPECEHDLLESLPRATVNDPDAVSGEAGINCAALANLLQARLAKAATRLNTAQAVLPATLAACGPVTLELVLTCII